MIAQTAQHSITKTETGDERIYGAMIGIVVDKYEENKKGKVCVQIPTRDEKDGDQTANELKWATLAMPFFGGKWGMYFAPEVGDQVILVFENGNIEKPYVIAAIPTEKSRVLQECFDEKNGKKRIQTRHGSSITFEDQEEGEGEKDKISIQTAKQMQTITLNNENQTYTMIDKEKKNKMTWNFKEGTLQIQAEKKLELKVGDITLSLDGESGKVDLKASDFQADLQNTARIRGRSSATLEGPQVDVKANNQLSLKSDGGATLKGSTLQMG